MPTREEIESEMTKAGGWTRDTLAKWGVSWPPPKGWKEAIIKGHSRYYTSGKMHVNQAFKMSIDRYGPQKKRQAVRQAGELIMRALKRPLKWLVE